MASQMLVFWFFFYLSYLKKLRIMPSEIKMQKNELGQSFQFVGVWPLLPLLPVKKNWKKEFGSCTSTLFYALCRNSKTRNLVEKKNKKKKTFNSNVCSLHMYLSLVQCPCSLLTSPVKTPAKYPQSIVCWNKEIYNSGCSTLNWC